ncbi:glycosyltransferase family 2 protein [bacterium SCSIO 12741]|nr:glycosyltransferase family 2 protein [bacterium SCSIO 12741]
MSKLSAVIITLNEEKNIARAIESLQGVVDEIVIMDSFSTDNTVQVCKDLGCEVYQQKWLGYSGQKNKANSMAKHPFILSLDADEALSDRLKKEIIQAKSSGLAGTYSFNRLTQYCGHWVKHGGWYPDVKVRIFPKDKTSWAGEFVHETLEFSEDLSNTHLSGDLLHYSYYNYSEHRERADHYSALTAQKMFARGKKAGPLKPFLSAFARFMGMYFFKGGILDGKMGFMIAWISAQSNHFKYTELKRLHREKA